MAISRDELLAYAASIATDGCCEVAHRSSMSRAYYAAFHSMLPLVEMLPASAKSRGAEVTHVELTERLAEWKVAGVCAPLNRYKDVKARALRAMEAARAKRVVADYRLGQEVDASSCTAQLERVRQICRAADTLLEVVNGASADAETGTL